jgi:hypothetical protein
MPRSGALLLSDYPTEYVNLACSKCERRGRLRKDPLIEEHGPDIALPDLLADLAKCARRGSFCDACGAYYPALKPIV